MLSVVLLLAQAQENYWLQPQVQCTVITHFCGGVPKNLHTETWIQKPLGLEEMSAVVVCTNGHIAAEKLQFHSKSILCKLKLLKNERLKSLNVFPYSVVSDVWLSNILSLFSLRGETMRRDAGNKKTAGYRIWREVLTGDPHKSLASLLDSDKPVQLYLLRVPACLFCLLFMHIQRISHLFYPLFGSPSHFLSPPNTFPCSHLFHCLPPVFATPTLLFLRRSSSPLWFSSSRSGLLKAWTLFFLLCLLNWFYWGKKRSNIYIFIYIYKLHKLFMMPFDMCYI